MKQGSKEKKKHLRKSQNSKEFLMQNKDLLIKYIDWFYCSWSQTFYSFQSIWKNKRKSLQYRRKLEWKTIFLHTDLTTWWSQRSRNMCRSIEIEVSLKARCCFSWSDSRLFESIGSISGQYEIRTKIQSKVTISTIHNVFKMKCTRSTDMSLCRPSIRKFVDSSSESPSDSEKEDSIFDLRTVCSPVDRLNQQILKLLRRKLILKQRRKVEVFYGILSDSYFFLHWNFSENPRSTKQGKKCHKDPAKHPKKDLPQKKENQQTNEQRILFSKLRWMETHEWSSLPAHEHTKRNSKNNAITV